jgi:hypothetical protein
MSNILFPRHLRDLKDSLDRSAGVEPFVILKMRKSNVWPILIHSLSVAEFPRSFIRSPIENAQNNNPYSIYNEDLLLNIELPYRPVKGNFCEPN